MKKMGVRKLVAAPLRGQDIARRLLNMDLETNEQGSLEKQQA